MTEPGPSKDDARADPASSDQADGARGPRYWGRRLAQGLYYGFVVFVATAAVWQITEQVYFPETPSEDPPFDACEDGLRAFYDSIGRARRVARRAPPGGDESAEAALRRYRAALEPLWRHRGAVARMCEGTPNEGLLDAIERLRYSEEHGVRHQAHELTALRRRVSNLVAERLPPASDEMRRPKTTVPSPRPEGPSPAEAGAEEDDEKR